MGISYRHLLAILLLLASQAYAEMLPTSTQAKYSCNINNNDEVELLTRAGRGTSIWIPTDYNSEMNAIRKQRTRWQNKYQSRKERFGESFLGTRRAKKRWKGFQQRYHLLAGCVRLLTVSAQEDPCVEIAPETDPSSLFIVNGNRCLPKNSSVVKLELLFAFSTGGCSGTVLDAHTVLTAAHCVEAKPIGIRIVTGRETVDADSYLSHPEYDPFTLYHIESFDVAIIKTTETLTVPASPLISGSIATGESAIIAGYGIDEQGEVGNLRAVNIPISYIDEDTIATKFNRKRSNGNTCFGDSGGPLFVHRLGEWIVAGITSNGDKNNCGLGDISRYTNITRPAIRSFIEENR